MEKMGKCPFQKKKKSGILPHFPNKLGKYPSFETLFSQNLVIKKKKNSKPYSGVLRSL